MARYRIILPVRAIGGYRLPEEGLAADGVTLKSAAAPAYTARVNDVQASNATLAYEQAQRITNHLFGYLALLGESAAFIIDGREGVRGRNVDLEENPIPAEQTPPPFESIGGVITAEGQDFVASKLDPDGSGRRSGLIVVHNSEALIVPGKERLTQLCDLFGQREATPVRLRVALGIIHDAECAREFTNGFSQSFTALEVLTEHLRPASVLDSYYQKANDDKLQPRPHQTKDAFLKALRDFLTTASLSTTEVDRIVNYTSSAQSVSQVDVFYNYLTSLDIAVTRSEIGAWRKMRGALVHAGEDSDQVASMRHFRDVVRKAMLEELRHAAADSI